MTTRHRSSKHVSPFRSRSDYDAAPSCSLQARLPTTGDRRGRGDDRHGRTDSRARIAAQCVKRPASHFLQPQRRPVRRHAPDAAQAMGAMPLRPLWRARARSLMPSSRNPPTIRDVRPGRLPPAGYRHRASHTSPMTPPRMASATPPPASEPGASTPTRGAGASLGRVGAGRRGPRPALDPSSMGNPHEPDCIPARTGDA